MPAYVYLCDDCGCRQQITRGMHEKHPETLSCVCGGAAHRDFHAEQGGNHNRMGKELYCDHSPYDPGPGAEVHPDQIAEVNAYIKERGFEGIHFEPTPDGMAGRAVVTSRRGWKKYAESVGTFNKDGGYSDPQPNVQKRPSEPKFVTIEES